MDEYLPDSLLSARREGDKVKEYEVPIHLQSTYNMLKRGFNENVDENTYDAILYHLHDYMSIRCLAKIMTYFVNKDYGEIYNDILGIENLNINSDTKNKVLEILIECGYNEWAKEE